MRPRGKLLILVDGSSNSSNSRKIRKVTTTSKDSTTGEQRNIDPAGPRAELRDCVTFQAARRVFRNLIRYLGMPAGTDLSGRALI